MMAQKNIKLDQVKANLHEIRGERNNRRRNQNRASTELDKPNNSHLYN